MGILDIQGDLANKELDREPYPWGRRHYKAGQANNWTVAEISLQDDQEQWATNKLSPAERKVVEKNLQFFGICETLTQDSIALVVMRYAQDGHVRGALIRQSYEEALHAETFDTVAESLTMSISDIYQGYKSTPTLLAKIDFLKSILGEAETKGFEIETVKGKQDFLRVAFGFFQILEGTFFFTNFAQLFSLRRKGLMKGLASFIDYISRDESVHIAIGRDLIRTVIAEYPEVWTTVFKLEIEMLFERAVHLEDAYIDASLDASLIGLSAEDFKQYVRFIANRRLRDFGLLEKWADVRNPFPWMSTETDLATETNFFESKVKEYSTGKLKMDDF